MLRRLAELCADHDSSKSNTYQPKMSQVCAGQVLSFPGSMLRGIL